MNDPAAVRLSLAVQHHPARSDLLDRLLASLGPDAACAEVVVDPDPAGQRSPWRTYRAALELTPAWATHRLVVQDDCIAAPGMLPAAEAAVAARPGSLVCLFVTGHRNGCAAATARNVRRAAAAGQPWAPMNPQCFLPAVATVWPARLAADMVAWVDSRSFRPDRLLSDDYLAGTFAKIHRLQAWATVPCLVQHPDDNESLIGKPNAFGASPGRCAALWQPDLDLSAVDWTVTPARPR